MTACIEWTKGRTTDGYGKRTWHGVTWRAHRAAWVEAHGPIPDGMCVLHRCDNPPCVNVDHLWLGTQAENMADRDEKGRQRNQFGAMHPDVCVNGHPYTEDNIYDYGTGIRCKTCTNNHARRRHAANRSKA